jgi:hypothetical protein
MQAQEVFISKTDYWYNYIVSAENKQREKNKESRIKQKQVLNKKQQPTTYGYDTEGRVVRYNKGKSEAKSAYLDGDQKEYIAFYSKKKLIELDSFRWEGKKLKECIVFDKNNKLFKRERYKYDSTYVTEYTYEKLRRKKLIEFRKHTYEYYPDFSYKKITYYKRGKPKRYSVFDCNPVGQNHKINKDSTYSCIKYDIDSLGNKVKVTITNDRGFSWKNVEYFNDKDQCIAHKTYDLKKNDELMWAYYYIPGTFNLTKFISYKRSKEYYRIENNFNNEMNCTETTTYRKGKLKTKGVNKFNEKGLITLTERFNEKGKKKEEMIYTYEYY